MAIGMIAAEAGIRVPVDRPVALHLEGRIAILVVILSFLILDGSRIAGAIGGGPSRANHERARSQRDCHHCISEKHYLLRCLRVRVEAELTSTRQGSRSRIAPRSGAAERPASFSLRPTESASRQCEYRFRAGARKRKIKCNACSPLVVRTRPLRCPGLSTCSGQNRDAGEPENQPIGPHRIRPRPFPTLRHVPPKTLSTLAANLQGMIN
jgi:hypothetical protein